jgi:hypothetical protein
MGLVRRLADKGLAFCYVANIALLIAAYCWVYFDGRSVNTFNTVQAKISARDLGDPVRIVANASTHRLLLLAGAAFVVITLLQMFIGLFFGGPRFRSMRMWMAFVAVAAGWLAFAVSWPDIYWLGQKHRLLPYLPAADSLSSKLKTNWPTQDGDSPELGPFLAYPQGAATIVLPLKSTTFPNSDLRFLAIANSGGAMRFQLGGEECGAWLERRTNGTTPTPFKDGLETRYIVERSELIAPGWFLVHYDAVTGGP